MCTEITTFSNRYFWHIFQQKKVNFGLLCKIEALALTLIWRLLKKTTFGGEIY